MSTISLTALALIGISSCAFTFGGCVAVAQTPDKPPMSGGYTNVIAIPVDDPPIKAVAGALFKPEGAGPFPAVIYMSDCDGVGVPWALSLQENLVHHLLSRGVAILILDSFTPRRNEKGDVTLSCARRKSAATVDF